MSNTIEEWITMFFLECGRRKTHQMDGSQESIIARAFFEKARADLCHRAECVSVTKRECPRVGPHPVDEWVDRCSYYRLLEELHSEQNKIHARRKKR